MQEENFEAIANLWRKVNFGNFIVDYFFGYGFAGCFLLGSLSQLWNVFSFFVLKKDIPDYSTFSSIFGAIVTFLVFLLIHKLGTASLRFYKSLKKGDVRITIKEILDVNIHQRMSYEKGDSWLVLTLTYTDGQKSEFSNFERRLLKDVQIGDEVIIYGDPFRRCFTLPIDYQF